MNQRITPLVALIVLVSAVFLTLHYVSDDHVDRFVDPPMLTVIVLAYFAATVVMLVRTRLGPWSILGAGLLATLTADALLYYVILAGRMDWEVPYPGELLALIRAMLVVGAPFVVLGLLFDWIDERARNKTDIRQALRETDQDERFEQGNRRDRRQDRRSDRQDHREHKQDVRGERLSKREDAINE